MPALKVKKLDPHAKLPTVAHPGEDLAYDLYALEDTGLRPGLPIVIRTGIAAQAFTGIWNEKQLGLLIRDRSSMAARGMIVAGGVIDHGYTGEIKVIMYSADITVIQAGDKIAQMIPIPILTGPVEEVAELEQSVRGSKGFGSTGK